jgi:hypothetical protein
MLGSPVVSVIISLPGVGLVGWVIVASWRVGTAVTGGGESRVSVLSFVLGFLEYGLAAVRAAYVPEAERDGPIEFVDSIVRRCLLVAAISTRAGPEFVSVHAGLTWGGLLMCEADVPHLSSCRGGRGFSFAAGFAGGKVFI